MFIALLFRTPLLHLFGALAERMDDALDVWPIDDDEYDSDPVLH